MDIIRSWTKMSNYFSQTGNHQIITSEIGLSKGISISTFGRWGRNEKNPR